MRFSSDLLTRRGLLTAAVLLPHSPLLPLLAPLPSAASDTAPAGQKLLGAIPEMPFGAPATRVTLAADIADEIERQAIALEALGTRDLAKDPRLSGSWRLLYSNAREIQNLAAGLPLGFALGKTYQPVDAATGRFENQGQIEHVLGLARASTTVVGDVRVTPDITVNAAGTKNVAGSRIDVDFRRLVFALDEALGVPTALRKVVVPTNDPKAAQPCNDITYLDETMRVTRGGDDSIFVFRREPSERPLLSLAEREALYAEGGAAVVTGKGIDDDDNSSPELRKLLEKR